uniref:Uncharacterized protein n=1 Tax=Strigamia maritima TaxID=126957 RepID=T1JKK9_STRMM
MHSYSCRSFFDEVIARMLSMARGLKTTSYRRHDRIDSSAATSSTYNAVLLSEASGQVCYI